jgi:cell division protein FtsB
MGIPVNQLRKQVASERKKRKLIFFTVVFLSFLYLFITLLFGDMGLLQYRELAGKKIRLEAQVTEIGRENEQIRSEIKAIRPLLQGKTRAGGFWISKAGRIHLPV